MRTRVGKKPLKVLHIDAERAWGGGERQVLGLLDYLASQGHESHLICHPDGLLRREAQKRKVPSFPTTIRNEFDLRSAFFIRRLIQTEKYDIVHFHTKRAHALALWLGHPHPLTRYVVTRRMDYSIGRNWYTHCLYNRRVHGVVAISDRIAGVLIAAGVRKEKIRVIHSAIDTTEFLKLPQTGRNPDVPVFGTVASLEERKGHRFLLEAAAAVKRQGRRAIYHFAGDGREKKRLRKLAAELDLEEETIFMGFVSDIPAFLAGIDCFVLPSVYEGLGVAILEAMAAGKPVIATNVGGIPELLEDHATGLLVPARDPGALAQAISGMISDPAEIRRMGEKAQEKVRTWFTLDQMGRQNEDYYYELLQADTSESLAKEEVGRIGP